MKKGVSSRQINNKDKNFCNDNAEKIYLILQNVGCSKAITCIHGHRRWYLCSAASRTSHSSNITFCCLLPSLDHRLWSWTLSNLFFFPSTIVKYCTSVCQIQLLKCFVFNFQHASSVLTLHTWKAMLIATHYNLTSFGLSWGNYSWLVMM